MMMLEILLPFKVFLKEPEVNRIVVESSVGALGILPQRLDCATVLVPGIMEYQTSKEGKIYIALDEGILVKTGANVIISARNAIGGASLGELRELVEKEFLELDEREKSVRSVMAKLESDFIHQFEKFRKS